jgi:hypothetical protein
MEVCTARVINIHEEGAEVHARSVPEGCREVWFGLGALPLEWARGLVLSEVRDRRGTTYHIAFREPCAPGIIDAAHGCVEEDGPYELDAWPLVCMLPDE